MKKMLLEITHDEIGEFLSRPNRYLAEVKINDKVELVHVHDPGRLKELLLPNTKVYLKKASNPNRKTSWDLIAVDNGGEKVLLNSAYHRYIAQAYLDDFTISKFGKYNYLKPEMKYKDSRLDFYLENDKEKIWIEVKGCTLTVDDVALFPDAPTKRGLKHLTELEELKKENRAAIIILVFRKSEYFSPNFETDVDFSEKLIEVSKNGVEVYPIQLEFKDDKIYYIKNLELHSFKEVNK
ncbi:MAG: DNA/RNA nuclease SfsA [Sebaldella sp.]|nr:DNA/RNA nuclease SfsA [Sebaldella sp.]